MEHMTSIERHLTKCNQCFEYFLTRLADMSEDSGACATGRLLLPRIGGSGVALALPSPESDVEHEVRTRCMVAR